MLDGVPFPSEGGRDLPQGLERPPVGAAAFRRRFESHWMVPWRAGGNPFPKDLTIGSGQGTPRRHLPGGHLGPEEAGLGVAGDQSRPVVSASKSGFELRQVQAGGCQRGVVAAEAFSGDQVGGPRLLVRRADLRMRPIRQRQASDGHKDDDGSVSFQEKDLRAILHDPRLLSRSAGAGFFQSPNPGTGGLTVPPPSGSIRLPSPRSGGRPAGYGGIWFSPLGQLTSSDSTRVLRPNPKLTR